MKNKIPKVTIVSRSSKKPADNQLYKNVDFQTKIKSLIENFSTITDIQFAKNGNPSWPLRDNDLSLDKDLSSNLLFMIAAINQGRICGDPLNARRIVLDIFEPHRPNYLDLGCQQIQSDLKKISPTVKLGPDGKLIPRILAGSCNFIRTICNESIYNWGKEKTIDDIVDGLSNSGIEKIGKTKNSARKKIWMFMRWMVRSSPDLGFWKSKGPQNLMVPVDSNVATIAELIGLFQGTKLTRSNPGKKHVELITGYAKTLYESDPAKIDYPFFLLGTKRQKDGNEKKIKEEWNLSIGNAFNIYLT